MSAEKARKGFKAEDEKKSSTTNHRPLTRSRARQLQTKNPAPAVTKRRPLVQTTTVDEECDAERRGVLRQRSKYARTKMTADMKKTQGPSLDACKSFIPAVYSGAYQKCKNDPQYVSGAPSKIVSYFERLEREHLRRDGAVLQSSKRYADLKDYRTRVVNWIFHKGYQLHVSSDTLHLAVYYVDRFLETYTGPDVNSTTVAVAAVHLASTFEAVETQYLDHIFRALDLRGLKESDVLELEVEFCNHLGNVVGLTARHFVSRYLHAVGRKKVPSERHTAHYLCALSVCHFPFTGHYYSKIAAAAVFIAYNKYRAKENPSTNLIYPPELEARSGYKLSELREVVLELADLTRITEFRAALHARRTPTDMGMYAVYKRYAALGVATSHILPDFRGFFKTYQEPITTPEQTEEEEDQESVTPVQRSKNTDSTSTTSSENQSTTAKAPVNAEQEKEDENESQESDSEHFKES